MDNAASAVWLKEKDDSTDDSQAAPEMEMARPEIPQMTPKKIRREIPMKVRKGRPKERKRTEHLRQAILTA